MTAVVRPFWHACGTAGIRCGELRRATVLREARISRELAPSAWEAYRSTPLGPLTSQTGRPGVAVIDRSSPWLIAR
jgi:hypothetical protein